MVVAVVVMESACASPKSEIFATNPPGLWWEVQECEDGGGDASGGQSYAVRYRSLTYHVAHEHIQTLQVAVDDRGRVRVQRSHTTRSIGQQTSTRVPAAVLGQSALVAEKIVHGPHIRHLEHQPHANSGAICVHRAWLGPYSKQRDDVRVQVDRAQ